MPLVYSGGKSKIVIPMFETKTILFLSRPIPSPVSFC